MGTRPEEIRSEIEDTRDRLTAEIDELTDRYSPGRVAGRKAHEAKDAAVSVKDKVGASAAGVKDRLTPGSNGHHSSDGHVHAVGAKVADVAHRGADAAQHGAATTTGFVRYQLEAHPQVGDVAHKAAGTASTAATKAGGAANQAAHQAAAGAQEHRREVGLAGAALALLGLVFLLVTRGRHRDDDVVLVVED